MALTHPNVLILYTGGTIGMSPTREGYGLTSGYLPQTLPTLLAPYADQLPRITIQEYQPLMDSANMSPTDWVTIAKDIARERLHYDGFLILHGTDTLAYTASALSFMLQNLDKPVICTGAQLPLFHARTDALQNIIDSLLFIQHHPIPEVCVYFDRVLLRGNRTRKTDASQIHAFTSPNYPALGHSGVSLTLQPDYVLPHPTQPFRLQLIHQPLIAYLPLFPGLSAQLLQAWLDQPLNGLVIGSYGTGNGPAHDQAILKTLRTANDRGIVMLNVTQCLHGCVNMKAYATGHAFADCGVLSGFDMTPEAALTKLYTLFSTGESLAHIKHLATQSLCGELTP